MDLGIKGFRNCELFKGITTISILKSGQMTVKELAEQLEKPESTIRMELNRKVKKSIYAKRGNQWGLLAFDHE